MTAKILLFLFGGIAVSCASCSSAPETVSSPNAIVGTDDRHESESTLLRSVVGTLQIGKSRCAAFASKADEITTAAHCLPENEYLFASTPQFVTSDGGQRRIIDIVALDRRKDLARLRVDKVFPTFLQTARSSGETLQVVARDGETGRLVVDDRCSQRQAPYKGLIAHGCDTVPGNSGAPIVQSGRVVGMHLGYSLEDELNLGIDFAAIDERDVDVSRLAFARESSAPNSWIDEELRRHIDILIAAGRFPVPAGFFQSPGEIEIFWSNGVDAYCHVPEPRFVTGRVAHYTFDVHRATHFRRDGRCPGT